MDDGGALKMEAYRMTIKKLLPIAAAAVLLIGLAVSPAAADTITYNLTVPNTALSSYPQPYASVYIDLTSGTTATIKFTGLTSTNTNGTYTYILGTTNAADLNVNGAFSVSNINFTGGCTGTGCPAGGTGFTVGSGNVSSFGSFNLTLTNNDGFKDAVSSVTFTLTDTSGTWSSASNVLLANSLGNFAAAHVFATGATCNGACVTGFASNTSGSFTPEPNTAFLLGLALFGLGFVFWRRGMLRI